MRYSYSRVDCFRKCKYKFRLRYLDELETIPDVDAANPLIIGHALHTGIEKGLDAALKEYVDSFPVLTDEQINEMIKLQSVVPLTVQSIPPDGQHEVEIGDEDFVGFIDYLVPVDGAPNTFDIYDFKYSNNTAAYAESAQLHLYKHYYEQSHPGSKVRNLYFVFVPKVQIRQKKTETLPEFRQRLAETLKGVSPTIVPIGFDYRKVTEFLTEIKHIAETSDFPKEPSKLCDWCEYQEYCEKGMDFMILPENKRRTLDNVTKHTLWIYGAPFSGKTTFANTFPEPLMINTDGNIKFVDAPYIRIRDDVKVEGRMTKRTLAWEVFKDVISELEKKENTYKTIVIDLLEDLYEYCRLYMYQQMGITHESDDSYRAWDKVRSEFLKPFLLIKARMASFCSSPQVISKRRNNCSVAI